MRSLRAVSIAVLLLVSSLPVAGCRGTTDPERELRELLRGAEAAVEAKDFGALRPLLSERYSDAEGNDRRRVEAVLRVWLLRQGEIYLVTRVQDLRFPAADRAQVVLLVAMAGERIADSADLAGLRGDLYRFDLDFAAERGDWRLARAAWRPMEPEDLL